MISAFGIDHGEIAKGLPSAVKTGGGGHYGALLRAKNRAGALGAQHPQLRRTMTPQGQSIKEGLSHRRKELRAQQNVSGKATRRLRAELLNETGRQRRAGYTSLAASSGVKRGFRGRVSNPMEKLP